MATIPFPYGRQSGEVVEKRLGRMEFKAAPVVPDSIVDEERHRAEVERALRAGDDALAQIERRLRALEAAVFP